MDKPFRQPMKDDDLARSFKENLQIFDTDAANDELKVGRLLMNTYTNIKVLLKDHAHGCERTLGCGWVNDPL